MYVSLGFVCLYLCYLRPTFFGMDVHGLFTRTASFFLKWSLFSQQRQMTLNVKIANLTSRLIMLTVCYKDVQIRCHMEDAVRELNK